jgi:hypothetical protein
MALNDLTPINDRYEVYRIVTDYEALREGFADRIQDLDAPLCAIDDAAGLTRGLTQKMLCTPPVKNFGPKSLEGMLKATGLALVFVVDDERFAAVKANLIAKKRHDRMIIRRVKPKWLFTGEKVAEIQRKRWSGVPIDVRKKLMKKVGRARKAVRLAADRKRKRAARLLAAQCAVSSSDLPASTP